MIFNLLKHFFILWNIQNTEIKKVTVKIVVRLGWCLGGAYFLGKSEAGGAYSGGAYKKSV